MASEAVPRSPHHRFTLGLRQHIGNLNISQRVKNRMPTKGHGEVKPNLESTTSEVQPTTHPWSVASLNKFPDYYLHHMSAIDANGEFPDAVIITSADYYRNAKTELITFSPLVSDGFIPGLLLLGTHLGELHAEETKETHPISSFTSPKTKEMKRRSSRSHSTNLYTNSTQAPPLQPRSTECRDEDYQTQTPSQRLPFKGPEGGQSGTPPSQSGSTEPKTGRTRAGSTACRPRSEESHDAGTQVQSSQPLSTSPTLHALEIKNGPTQPASTETSPDGMQQSPSWPLIDQIVSGLDKTRVELASMFPKSVYFCRMSPEDAGNHIAERFHEREHFRLSFIPNLSLQQIIVLVTKLSTHRSRSSHNRKNEFWLTKKLWEAMKRLNYLQNPSNSRSEEKDGEMVDSDTVTRVMEKFGRSLDKFDRRMVEYQRERAQRSPEYLKKQEEFQKDIKARNRAVDQKLDEAEARNREMQEKLDLLKNEVRVG